MSSINGPVSAGATNSRRSVITLPSSPRLLSASESRLARLEARSGVWAAAFVVGLVVQLASLVLYFPRHIPDRLAFTYAPLCAQPFTHEAVHEPGIRGRILGPLMAYAVGLRGPSGAAIPFAANLPMLACAYVLIRRRSDPGTALLSTALLSTTLATITSQTWLGYSDSLANLALIACLLVRSPIALGGLLLTGMFADERIAAAVPLVLLWHHIEDGGHWRATITRAAALGVAVGLWWAGNAWLLATFAHDPQGFNQLAGQALRGDFLRHHLRNLPVGIFYAFRWAWLLPITLGWHWLGQRNFGRLAVLLGTMAACAGLAGLVLDMSRVMSVTFPALLLAVACFSASWPELNRLGLLVLLLANVATPAGQVIGTEIVTLTPLPLSLAYIFRQL